MTRYSRSLWTRRRMLGASAAAFAAPAILPRRAWAQGNEIRLGWISPTTGPVAAFGSADDYILAAIETAIGPGIEINGTTHPVRIIRKDTQSNPNRAAEVASDLILRDEVHLMLSSSTADTVLPATDQCELNEVPSLSTDTPWDAFFFGRGGNPAVGFDWTYHFFWGGQQIIDCYASLWDQLDTNRRVGVLMSNDSDGVALSHPENGFAAMIARAGFEVVNGGLFPPLADDYTAQIARMRDAGVDIISGVFLPPDWTTFWTQSAQQGFRPKAATIAKALLFHNAIEALGPLGHGLSTEVWWAPQHPFLSSVTGQTSRQISDGYVAQAGRPWVQPMGYKHALAEVAVDVLRRCADPFDPGAMVEAIQATRMQSLVGNIAFSGAPVPNVCSTPVVGGQWVRRADGGVDLSIAENLQAPEIPVDAPFFALN
jgi:branched-chain amino acid transport system substrate-binding protein